MARQVGPLSCQLGIGYILTTLSEFWGTSSNSAPLPDLVNQNLHFSEMSRIFKRMLSLRNL